MNYFDETKEAAQFLGEKLAGLAPRVAIVLGSGLGAVAEALVSTVEGHSGRIVAGLLGGVPVVVMQGRVHYYEGYTPQQVTFPMRVLGALGIQTVILTNAAGGIRPEYQIGDLVLLSDHINALGFNPLIGPNEPRFGDGIKTGLRFLDMTQAYSVELRALAHEAARAGCFALREGVYLATSGPSFETPAEIRAFRTLGADLVGMSTVPETIVARHMGLQVLGISCVTNLAAGISATQLSHEEVFEAGSKVQHRLAGLLERLVPAIAATHTEPTT